MGQRVGTEKLYSLQNETLTMKLNMKINSSIGRWEICDNTHVINNI